jgi:FkbM family methyltransferase
MASVTALKEIAGAVASLVSMPELLANVPLHWLVRSQSRLNGRFVRQAVVSVEDDDQTGRKVVVDGQIYVWPRHADVGGLLTLISELTTPYHPHQYLWGSTKLSSGDVCLDIGACEGAFSAQASALGAVVICVEPSRMMAAVIRRLYELRGLPSPWIESVGLGSKAGEAAFNDDGNNPGASSVASSGGYRVRIETLDDLVGRLNLDRLDFIKCDAEGMDLEIIRSGPNTLRRLRPKVAITTYHDASHFQEIKKFLCGLGYQVAGKGFHRVGNRFRVVMLHAWPAESNLR